MLEVKPVKKAKMPAYPLKADAQKDPELLKRLPQRWQTCRKAAIAAGLAATLTISLSSCATAGAPLPPSLVSEEDALQIIKNTMNGYVAELQPLDSEDIGKPVKYVQYDKSTETFSEVIPESSAKKIIIDAYDTKKSIGIEYRRDELKSDNEAYDFSSAKKIERANKDDAHVLLIYNTPVEDGQGNATIKAQVEAFINWLK